MQTDSNYKSFRENGRKHPRELDWPVNEIMLQSLITNGKTDREIADLCGVETERVTELRRDYGL